MILYSSDKKDKTTTRSTIRHAANKVDETGKKDKPDRQEKTKTTNKVVQKRQLRNMTAAKIRQDQLRQDKIETGKTRQGNIRYMLACMHGMT